MKLRPRPPLALLALALAVAPASHAQAQERSGSQPAAPASNAAPWYFAVSGDSRNCGDVVMPAIAAGVWKENASFYWHLGDFRAIYDFDEDMKNQPEHLAKPMSVASYLQSAWDDFLQNQIAPFGTLPVFLGIGNHDTIPPLTRDALLIQFADWLDTPTLRKQRLSDDGNDHKLKTYYHWVQGNVDFINLDNATPDQFDSNQLRWFEKLLQTDSNIPQISTVVLGMHEALPESISYGHSMNESIVGTETGRTAYQDLLKLQNDAHKHVYVLASHSHYFIDGVYNTDYWRTHGGVLPGWIVGTAGAVRYYPLPAEAKTNARAAETKVYGFLLGAVKPTGEIEFTFHRVEESDVPSTIVERYKPDFVHWCFAENSHQYDTGRPK
jgi:hypothetical protein